MKSLFHDCHWLNCKIWEIPWPQQNCKLAFQSTIIFEFMAITSMLWNFTKKPEKMKKAFCFNICARHFLRQNLSTSDLSFCQVTSVEKRELQEHFSASACGLSFKKLSLGSLLSTSVTWGKTKITVEKFSVIVN